MPTQTSMLHVSSFAVLGPELTRLGDVCGWVCSVSWPWGEPLDFFTLCKLYGFRFNGSSKRLPSGEMGTIRELLGGNGITYDLGFRDCKGP